jgi:hypothetical protein
MLTNLFQIWKILQLLGMRKIGFLKVVFGDQFHVKLSVRYAWFLYRYGDGNESGDYDGDY